MQIYRQIVRICEEKNISIARLEKELAAAEKDLGFFAKKLDNPGFMSKAPEAEIEKTKASAAKLEEKIKMIKESLEKLA